MLSTIRLRRGYAKYSDLAMMLAYSGDTDPFNAPTIIIVLDDARSKAEWGAEQVDDVFVDVCAFRSETMDRLAFVCVSEEGKVWFQHKERVIEDVPDAGLFKPTSLKLGHLRGIRQLGRDLYTFGYAGQIYRRSASETWEHFDHGILGVPGDQYDVTDMCLSGDTFYAVTRMGGEGRIYSSDGTRWTLETNTSGEWLNAIEADQNGAVWICGRNGTLLGGNAESGFTRLGHPQYNEEFLSIALFRGDVWLSSATSLYTWSSGSMSKVQTGISPDGHGANRLQVVDDVLWSFGYDEVLRFDGKKWTRFAVPGA